MTLKGRGKVRYKADEFYMKKNSNSNNATTNTSASTSSNRSKNPNKEISQFWNETDENEKKKLQQNNSQENLSKKYVNIINDIIKPVGGQGKNQKYDKIYVKKNVDEKSQNEESKNEKEVEGVDTTSSQRKPGNFTNILLF